MFVRMTKSRQLEPRACALTKLPIKPQTPLYGEAGLEESAKNFSARVSQLPVITATAPDQKSGSIQSGKAGSASLAGSDTGRGVSATAGSSTGDCPVFG